MTEPIKGGRFGFAFPPPDEVDALLVRVFGTVNDTVAKITRCDLVNPCAEFSEISVVRAEMLAEAAFGIAPGDGRSFLESELVLEAVAREDT